VTLFVLLTSRETSWSSASAIRNEFENDHSVTKRAKSWASSYKGPLFDVALVYANATGAW